MSFVIKICYHISISKTFRVLHFNACGGISRRYQVPSNRDTWESVQREIVEGGATLRRNRQLPKTIAEWVGLSELDQRT